MLPPNRGADGAVRRANLGYIALFAPKKFKIDPELGCFCGLFIFI
jgi:hypothetical protein